MNKESIQLSPALSNREVVQPGNIVYIKDDFYGDNNLSVMEVPRYSWKVMRVDNGLASCEFQRRGRNSVLSLTVEVKYLRKEHF